MKIYSVRLRHTLGMPRKTVESLFGTQSLRVAVDERNNLLIVYGKPDITHRLGRTIWAGSTSKLRRMATEKSTQGTASPRSLLLRVFWLADNLPEGAGQKPNEFLPKSVLDATRKLGLEMPRLVTQTVNSLATGKEDARRFFDECPGDAIRPTGRI